MIGQLPQPRLLNSNPLINLQPYPAERTRAKSQIHDTGDSSPRKPPASPTKN